MFCLALNTWCSGSVAKFFQSLQRDGAVPTNGTCVIYGLFLEE